MNGGRTLEECLAGTNCPWVMSGGMSGNEWWENVGGMSGWDKLSAGNVWGECPGMNGGLGVMSGNEW